MGLPRVSAATTFIAGSRLLSRSTSICGASSVDVRFLLLPTYCFLAKVAFASAICPLVAIAWESTLFCESPGAFNFSRAA
eukprot:5508907-Pyramimonas_sp.AAC.1